MIKILIIGMNYIGDTIFITPLIRELKRHYKDSIIDVVNGVRGLDILKENPYINKVIKNDENTLEYIKKEKYDIGYTATTAFYGASILYKAKIPIRVGVNSECRGLLLTHKTSWKKHNRHIIDTILAPLKKLNIEVQNKNTELFLTEEELFQGKIKMQNIEKALIVHGGATRISKRYSKENFAKLLKMFYENTKANIVLIGSKDDLDFSKYINKELGNIIKKDFTNKLTIRELISVIKQGYALIGGDSSPLHIANALGIYSIGIFGDTLPLVYGVRGEKAINIEQRKKYCTTIKSYKCEYIKRGCKTVDCLNKLEVLEIMPYLIEIYNN